MSFRATHPLYVLTLTAVLFVTFGMDGIHHVQSGLKILRALPLHPVLLDREPGSSEIVGKQGWFRRASACQQLSLLHLQLTVLDVPLAETGYLSDGCPRRSQVLLARARYGLSSGDGESATSALESLPSDELLAIALRAGSGSADPLEVRAQEVGQFRVHELSSAQRHSLYVTLGARLAAEGELAEAATAYREALVAVGTDAPTAIRLAVVLRRLEQYPAAITLLNDTLASQPHSNTDLRLNLLIELINNLLGDGRIETAVQRHAEADSELEMLRSDLSTEHYRIHRNRLEALQRRLSQASP